MTNLEKITEVPFKPLKKAFIEIKTGKGNLKVEEGIFKSITSSDSSCNLDTVELNSGIKIKVEDSKIVDSKKEKELVVENLTDKTAKGEEKQNITGISGSNMNISVNSKNKQRDIIEIKPDSSFNVSVLKGDNDTVCVDNVAVVYNYNENNKD